MLYAAGEKRLIGLSRHCTSLESLSISKANITDSGLIEKGGHCTSLQSLDITYCL